MRKCAMIACLILALHSVVAFSDGTVLIRVTNQSGVPVNVDGQTVMPGRFVSVQVPAHRAGEIPVTCLRSDYAVSKRPTYPSLEDGVIFGTIVMCSPQSSATPDSNNEHKAVLPVSVAEKTVPLVDHEAVSVTSVLAPVAVSRSRVGKEQRPIVPDNTVGYVFLDCAKLRTRVESGEYDAILAPVRKAFENVGGLREIEEALDELVSSDTAGMGSLAGMRDVNVKWALVDVGDVMRFVDSNDTGPASQSIAVCFDSPLPFNELAEVVRKAVEEEDSISFESGIVSGTPSFLVSLPRQELMGETIGLDITVAVVDGNLLLITLDKGVLCRLVAAYGVTGSNVRYADGVASSDTVLTVVLPNVQRDVRKLLDGDAVKDISDSLAELIGENGTLSGILSDLESVVDGLESVQYDLGLSTGTSPLTNSLTMTFKSESVAMKAYIALKTLASVKGLLSFDDEIAKSFFDDSKCIRDKTRVTYKLGLSQESSLSLLEELFSVD